MFGHPAKEPLKTALSALLALIGLSVLPGISASSEGSTTPVFASGAFLGSYVVRDVIETTSDGKRVSRCNTGAAGDISLHCAKHVWAVAGPGQLALLDAPNSQLKLSTRLEAFAMFGDFFCISSSCRWVSAAEYSALRPSLFSSSPIVRAFAVPEEAATGNAQLAEELRGFDVFIFHKDIPREQLAGAGADFANLLRELTTRQTRVGFPENTSTWRVLVPKDAFKQYPLQSPREILLRETFPARYLNVRTDNNREYVLRRK